MTDSHAHLTISPLDQIADQELKSFVEKGGKQILNASYDVESMLGVISQAKKYEKLFPGVLKTAVGLHPEEYIAVKSFEGMRKMLDLFEKTVADNLKYINFIGETGLDYYAMLKDEPTDKSVNIENVIEMQKISFTRHVEIAVKYGLPMTIHCRELAGKNRCVTDTLKILCETGKGKVKAIMHSYTGDLKAVDDILALGLYVGFNAIVTYKNAENVRAILKKVPLDRVLLETDAPLLVLRNTGAKYGSSSDIAEIARVVGEVKEVSGEEVIMKSNENFLRLQSA